MSLRGEEYLRLLKQIERSVRELIEGYELQGKTDAIESVSTIRALAEAADQLSERLPASAAPTTAWDAPRVSAG